MQTPDADGGSHRDGGKGSALRLLLPPLLAILLFVTAVFALLIPGMESAIMGRKREMVREITATAWNLLEHFHGEVEAGRMSREAAQREAVAVLRHIRYGDDNKDYLWITDQQPRMVMHPYRSGLEGQDLSDITDSHGKRLFKAFVDDSAADGEAFVDYYWQWKDDERRIASKLSYVRRFEPWNWIVGTGIYIDDAQAEIDAITGRFWVISLIIVTIICALLLFNYRTGLRIENERRRAEEDLQRSRERYRALVEANDEGVLLVVDNQIKTINRCAQELLGYGEHGLKRSPVAKLIPEGSPGADCYRRLREGVVASDHVETELTGAHERRVPVLLSASRMSVMGQEGIILTIKDLATQGQDERRSGLEALLDHMGLGLLRCQRAPAGLIREANGALARMLGQAFPSALTGRAARRLFHRAGDRSIFLRAMAETGRVEAMDCELRRHDGSTLPVRVWAEAPGDGEELLAAVLDRSREDRRARQAERLLGEFGGQQGQVFGAAATLARPVPTLPMDCSIHTLAACLSHTEATAVLLHSGAGGFAGIVTEGDLARRVVGEGLDYEAPAYSVMSAPMRSCGEAVSILEAIDTMRRHGLEHLVLGDDRDRPRLLEAQSLLDAARRGMVGIEGRIATAATGQALRECRDDLHVYVQALLRAEIGAVAIARSACHLADRILARCAELALAERDGQAPGPWCLLAVGSQGRREMTFATDQDNALVYGDDCTDEDRAWFLAFAERINELYEQAGYELCAGEAMARNPKWCQALGGWQRAFRQWIHRPEPQDLADVNVFFDFRPVAGTAELAEELRRDLLVQAKGRSIFFLQLAETTLTFKPPVGLFGGLRMDDDGEHGPGFCIKSALIPLINFARLYALAHGVEAVNTIERLDALRERGVLSDDTHRVLLRAQHLLMDMRLRHHAALDAAGRPSDNRIDPDDLDDWDRAELKRIFGHIADVQARIRYDFARQA